jgi:hypothetical protein
VPSRGAGEPGGVASSSGQYAGAHSFSPAGVGAPHLVGVKRVDPSRARPHGLALDPAHAMTRRRAGSASAPHPAAPRRRLGPRRRCGRTLGGTSSPAVEKSWRETGPSPRSPVEGLGGGCLAPGASGAMQAGRAADDVRPSPQVSLAEPCARRRCHPPRAATHGLPLDLDSPRSVVELGLHPHLPGPPVPVHQHFDVRAVARWRDLVGGHEREGKQVRRQRLIAICTSVASPTLTL